MNRTFAIVFFVVGFVVVASSGRAQSESDPHHAGVQRCLANWRTHPFDPASTRYRVIEPRVGVFGIGGDVTDDAATAAPELVYIRPAVSVMSKSVLALLNPNGWYCLEKSVAVMAKIEIQLHCRAHLASTEEGVTVMGAGDRGVNVMGATRVEKVGCNE